MDLKEIKQGRPKLSEKHKKPKFKNFNISLPEEELIAANIDFAHINSRENLKGKRSVLNFLIEFYKANKK